MVVMDLCRLSQSTVFWRACVRPTVIECFLILRLKGMKSVPGDQHQFRHIAQPNNVVRA